MQAHRSTSSVCLLERDDLGGGFLGSRGARLRLELCSISHQTDARRGRELHDQVAAPDHDGFGRLGVTFPPSVTPPSTFTRRTSTPPSCTTSSLRSSRADRLTIATNSVAWFIARPLPERGGRFGRATNMGPGDLMKNWPEGESQVWSRRGREAAVGSEPRSTAVDPLQPWDARVHDPGAVIRQPAFRALPTLLQVARD